MLLQNDEVLQFKQNINILLFYFLMIFVANLGRLSSIFASVDWITYAMVSVEYNTLQIYLKDDSKRMNNKIIKKLLTNWNVDVF